MKRFEVKDVMMIVVLVCMILITLVGIGIVVYYVCAVNDVCPVCGVQNWVRGDAHYLYVNGMLQRVYETVCANCGHVI